jgi:hypothetical protein
MRSTYFYSKKELDDMRNTLLSGGKMSDMITAHSIKWDRTYVGTRRRMGNMAHDLNISRKVTSGALLDHYTDEEELELINVLKSSSAPIEALARQICDKYGRTCKAISHKLYRLAKNVVRPVAQENEEKVKRNYNKKSKVQEPAKIKVVENKSPYFYSNEEVEDMKTVLSTTDKSIRVLVREHASKWNRGITGVSHRMYKVAKEIGSTRTKIHIDKTFVKKKTIKKHVPIIKEVPQTIGIDIPEGTSFDIQNVKRVVLQKDCFTVYF